MSEWIDVNDRFPEMEDNGVVTIAVLVYGPHGMHVAKYGPKTMTWYVTGDMDSYYDPIVTHWQPLPEPPREEGNPCGIS